MRCVLKKELQRDGRTHEPCPRRGVAVVEPNDRLLEELFDRPRDRWSGVTPTIGSPSSAALRSVSPARTPSPPLNVGTSFSSTISIEK
jgi:hypothetical protein